MQVKRHPGKAASHRSSERSNCGKFHLAACFTDIPCTISVRRRSNQGVYNNVLPRSKTVLAGPAVSPVGSVQQKGDSESIHRGQGIYTSCLGCSIYQTQTAHRVWLYHIRRLRHTACLAVAYNGHTAHPRPCLVVGYTTVIARLVAGRGCMVPGEWRGASPSSTEGSPWQIKLLAPVSCRKANELPTSALSNYKRIVRSHATLPDATRLDRRSENRRRS